jgi:hypothetical protein
MAAVVTLACAVRPIKLSVVNGQVNGAEGQGRPRSGARTAAAKGKRNDYDAL